MAAFARALCLGKAPLCTASGLSRDHSWLRALGFWCERRPHYQGSGPPATREFNLSSSETLVLIFSAKVEVLP